MLWVITFTKKSVTEDSIERIHERTKRKMFDYGTMGDLYALLNDNNFHEYVMLNDGSGALSMYGLASNELSLSF